MPGAIRRGSRRASPTKVIGADPTLPYSYLPTLDPSEVFAVGYDFLPDATHFLLLEQPEECVRTMREFLEPVLRPTATLCRSGGR